jgi:hypothetical protein
LPEWRRDNDVRVAFLFNHDQIHQVAHSLPVALALARAVPGLEIVLATTSDRLAAEVERLCAGTALPSLRHVRLGLRSRSSRLAAGALGHLVPAAKLLVYRDNLDFFGGLDLLVVSEKTSLLLKTRYGLERLRIVHTRHGAGDRAIGFDKASGLFDRVFVSGSKIRDRLIAEAGVEPSRVSIVGYPKFDLACSTAAPKLFDNDRPTILYNPHCSPHLSSWHRMGPAVLDHFARQDRYNLIFAPHVMLFERRWSVSIDRLRLAHTPQVARQHRDASGIHVDLGSRALTDMSYIEAADIYIGDVSSQVYEFLRRPRPCLFLNPRRINWRGDPNYAHWQAGPVIEDMSALPAAIEAAIADHDSVYRPVQEALFARTFDLTGRPSSERAAAAIIEMIARERLAA